MASLKEHGRPLNLRNVPSLQVSLPRSSLVYVGVPRHVRIGLASTHNPAANTVPGLKFLSQSVLLHAPILRTLIFLANTNVLSLPKHLFFPLQLNNFKHCAKDSPSRSSPTQTSTVSLAQLIEHFTHTEPTVTFVTPHTIPAATLHLSTMLPAIFSVNCARYVAGWYWNSSGMVSSPLRYALAKLTVSVMARGGVKGAILWRFMVELLFTGCRLLVGVFASCVMAA